MVFDFTIMSFRIFVQPGAQMDFAGGVGRAVVQDEERRAGARFQDAAVEPHLLPGGQLLRLALRQLRLHGEIGLRQIQGAFQVRFCQVRIKPFLECKRPKISVIRPARLLHSTIRCSMLCGLTGKALAVLIVCYNEF